MDFSKRLKVFSSHHIIYINFGLIIFVQGISLEQTQFDL